MLYIYIYAFDPAPLIYPPTPFGSGRRAQMILV
jgi:hypothetical protein